MKKQFQHIKNFVQDIKDINLNTRDNKNETLSSDLQKAEKKLDLIKQVCHNTEKKLIACLQLLPSGHLNNNSFTERNLNNVHPLTISSINNSLSSNTEDQLMDTLLLEKKQKKVPEVQLHQTLQEMGDLFDNDSILGVTLSVSGDIQKQLSKELLRYEQDVERLCLFPLNDIMENDIPAVLKSRNQFSKASSEVEKLKIKLNQANKNNQQNGNNQSHQRIKIESLTKELQDATNRLVQIKNNFVMDLYNFVGREAEFSCIYVQLFKLRANYHKNVLEIIEQNMPRLENIILSTSQKPVFGTSLVEYSKQTNLDLSIVLEYCLCLLNENLNEEGLFRIPGSSSKVKKLKTFFNFQTYQMIQEINNNSENSHKNFYLNSFEYFDEYVNDPHSVAGCLKSFFRELPEPLFMFSIYHDLVNCASIANINDRLTSLWKIINTMPSAHIENLKYLVKFFSKLSANSEVNKMNAQNIAIAIAPSLIWPSPDLKNSSNSSYNLDMCSANQYGIIIETLITYADWFFPGDLDFDIMKKNNLKFSENEQNQNVKTTPSSSNLNQNSPKTQSKAFSFKDRNPLPTPRMSTRIKKPPAPQAPSNMSNSNITNELNNFNDSPSNTTNSFFNLNNTGNSYCFNDFKFQNDNTESEIPTLKSFERKGSFQENKFNKFTKIVYNNCSTATSSSNSQDSVNSFSTNSDVKKNSSSFQNQKPISNNKNKSDDSLLATEETNSENYINSSSSSEELNLSKSTMLFKSDKKINKNLIQDNTSGNRYIGGSLDRRQIRNSQTSDRSRQIRQKSSYSFLHATSLRPKSKDRPQSLHIERPNIPPPERPIKMDKNSVRFQIKIKSHDDLLSDGFKNENSKDNLDNFSLNQSVEFNSFKTKNEKKSYGEDVNNDKKFNLKLNVKGRNYSEDNLLIENNSKELISYVNLDGNDLINKTKNQDLEKQVDLNLSQSSNSDLIKPPEKPPRISPSLIQNNESKIKPPRPSPPSIYKSKSLVNEHTYL